MPQGVRVVLFNSEEECAVTLRESLLQFDGVRIVAEVDEPALLVEAVGRLTVHVLVVNLDPTPEAILPIAGEVASTHPELAVFAVSHSTDGHLILAAMRRGVREFLPKPIDPQMLSEALRRVLDRLGETSRQGRLIAVLGGAGGVGATMLATNLAVELAVLSQGRTCLVDLDYRFGHVATMLDVEPTYTLSDLCAPERLETQVLEKALVRHSSGVHVLCSPTSFAQAETITAAHCVGVLSGLAGLHEYVVADGPSRFDPGAKPVLDVADDILVVTDLLVPHVRNVQRMRQAMHDVGFNLDRVKLVGNRISRDSGTLTVHDVESTLGTELFAIIPDDWAAVSGAINLGEPLAQCQPKSRVRQAIREIAVRLHGASDRSDDSGGSARDVPGAGPRKGGLLSKIFSNA